MKNLDTLGGFFCHNCSKNVVSLQGSFCEPCKISLVPIPKNDPRENTHLISYGVKENKA